MIRTKLIVFCCFLSLIIPASALALQVGDKLPTFIAKDLNGQTVDLNTIVGHKPVMLVIWSTYCGDCKKNLDKINEMVMKYRHKGIEFIGINIGRMDSLIKARAYVKKHKMSYPNIFDQDVELAKKYHLNKAFVLILAAKDGTVVMKLDNVPEFDETTIETLNTYNYLESKKPAADKAEAKK